MTIKKETLLIIKAAKPILSGKEKLGWSTRNYFKKTCFISFQNVVTLIMKINMILIYLLWKLFSVYVLCIRTCFYNYVLFFSFFQNMQPDKEILFDVITFLWQKCKMGLQQIQTSGSGYFKYIHKYKACKVLLYYNVFLLIWVLSDVVKPR